MSTLFDEINIFEPYKFTLIQTMKSRKPINILSTAFDRNINPSIADLDTLKFNLPFYCENPVTKVRIENPEYSSIQTENLILLKVGEPSNPMSQSYYIIKNITESTDGMTKSVECKSRQEVLNKNIITLDGIERELVNNVDNNGILNLIEQQTTWKIGYVDPNCLKDDILGSFVPRVRWLDSLSKPILQFLNEDIATAYNLIITYDTFNKLINVYDKDFYGAHTGILLSEENYIKNLTKSTKGDSVCTRLEVSGNDGMGISSLTLDSSSYITNYNYYITSNQMSSELVTSLSNFNILLTAKDIIFKGLKSQVDAIDVTLVTKNSELSALTELQKGLDAIQAGYMSVSDNVLLPAATTNCNNNRIAVTNKKAEIATLNTQIDGLNAQILQIANDINKKTAKIISTETLIFTDDLLEELEDFTLTEQWSSDVYTTPYLLKQAAEKVLVDYSVPVIEESMELVDLFALKEAQHIRGKIKLGDLVRAYSPKLKVNTDVRIVSYSYNIDTNSLAIVFSNKNKKLDDAKGIGSKITKAVNVGKYVNAKRLQWNEIQGTKNAVDTFLNNVLDTSAQAIISLQGKNKISITENGIFCVEKDNEDNGVCILAGLICFTDDGFMTVETALDKTGVYAQIIVGRLLLGEQLYIQNEDGTVGIDGLGITIKDTEGVLKVKIGNLGSGKFGIAIYNANGQVVLDSGGIQYPIEKEREENFDSTHGLSFLVKIPSTTQEIRTAKLSFKIMNYRAYEKSVIGGASDNTTSSSGGSHKHRMLKYNADRTNNQGDLVYVSYLEYLGSFADNRDFPMVLKMEDLYSPKNDIYTYSASNSHTHTNEHSHSSSLEYAIFESTPAKNVKVYINGVLRYDNGGVGYSSDTYDLELNNFLIIGQYNLIELTTSQNGRLHANIEGLAFVNS